MWNTKHIPKIPLGDHATHQTLPTLEQQIDFSGDLSLSPSLWAYPQMDFDEALGLLVVGNTFGELAVYDYIGVQPPGLWSISDDFMAICTNFGSTVL
jgi:hypothetical protein